MKKYEKVELKNYREPSYWIEKINLTFEIQEEKTRVVNCSYFIKNTKNKNNQIILDGEDLELESLSINGKEFEDYQLQDGKLIFEIQEEKFELKTTVIIYPKKNTSLEGLYFAEGMYCSQCEAEGFRKITYHQDHPDVMSLYQTKIIAPKSFPVLLSNGNLLEKGDMPGGRHYALWEDPFKKPSYLFALVVGDIVREESTYLTRGGKKIDLHIYTDEKNKYRVAHGMKSLKEAMKWDEDTYGLEYDLDLFMMVAIDSFNMGAMENKGLNIFNSQAVLGDESISTDDDLVRIRDIIAHEYFHNYSGNRVTCRSWFELSLKEGLTVFREHEFSGDLSGKFLKKIEDSRLIQELQFLEARGPNAHPVRPKEYLEVNNFYTVTVYEKGSELIGMLQTILTPKVFNQGVRQYFKDYDGQAVGIPDFIGSLEKVSGRDLSQFCLWYDQKRTPTVEMMSSWDEKEKKIHIEMDQFLSQIYSNEDYKSLLIPVELAFFNSKGERMSFDYDGERRDKVVLELTQPHHKYCFSFQEKVKVSALRNFSAPIYLKVDQSMEDYFFFYQYEVDGYSRYGASQKIHSYHISEILKSLEPSYLDRVVEIFNYGLLENKEISMSYASVLMEIPSVDKLSEDLGMMDYPLLQEARENYQRMIAIRLEKEFLQKLKNIDPLEDEGESGIKKRKMRKTLFEYLSLTPKKNGEIIEDLYYKSFRMEDKVTSMMALLNVGGQKKKKVFEDFYKKWSEDALILCKWFRLQSSHCKVRCDEIVSLSKDTNYSRLNPNKIYSLYRSYIRNKGAFHRDFTQSYPLVGEEILYLDGKNPIVASSLTVAFEDYKSLPKKYQGEMKRVLDHILSEAKSKNVLEKIQKIASSKLD